MEPCQEEHAEISLVELGPNESALAAIAEAFGVDAPPCSDWADFEPKPKPEPKAAAEKPAKQAKKKRTTKKAKAGRGTR